MYLVELLNLTFEQERRCKWDSNVKFAPLAGAATSIEITPPNLTPERSADLLLTLQADKKAQRSFNGALPGRLA